jgi:hypothetical protein
MRKQMQGASNIRSVTEHKPHSRTQGFGSNSDSCSPTVETSTRSGANKH